MITEEKDLKNDQLDSKESLSDAIDDSKLSDDSINQSADFILGKKVGMTSTYGENGNQYPTTVVEAGPCFVSQLKSVKSDGYCAVQISYLSNKNANKPLAGHFKKNNCEPLKYSIEFRINEGDTFSVGEKLEVNIFNVGDYVRVTGVSKGKGFAGVMKRHGFKGGRASHGKNSVMRKPGSVGAGSDPSRIWKGKKMPGRYGGYTVTYKNLEILKIDKQRNLLFIKGSVPGANNGLVSVVR
jgi:large subunit ribosomal protein L3